MYFEDFPGSTRKYWVFFIDSDLSQCNSWPQDTTGTPFASSPVGLRTRSNSVANFTSISPASPRGDMRSLPWFHFLPRAQKRVQATRTNGANNVIFCISRIHPGPRPKHGRSLWQFMIHSIIQWDFPNLRTPLESFGTPSGFPIRNVMKC